jgi:hypothetical protein
MLPPVTHERRDVGVHLVGLPRIEVAEDVGQLGAVVREHAAAVVAERHPREPIGEHGTAHVREPLVGRQFRLGPHGGGVQLGECLVRAAAQPIQDLVGPVAGKDLRHGRDRRGV